MEKFYQMNLHLLHHKREERLGLADYEPDFSIRPEQVDYVNCTKYLDAFALLYNLDIGRLQNEDIYSVLPDRAVKLSANIITSSNEKALWAGDEDLISLLESLSN